jgi:hypothetical protein
MKKAVDLVGMLVVSDMKMADMTVVSMVHLMVDLRVV